MSDEAGESIARRDEVLELLYWLEGEGFPDNATLPGLARFLSYPEPLVLTTLEALIRRGDVVLLPEGGYRLTEVGRREAGRLFAEEFAALMGAGHGECSDPDCDCRIEGPAACRHAHL